MSLYKIILVDRCTYSRCELAAIAAIGSLLSTCETLIPYAVITVILTYVYAFISTVVIRTKVTHVCLALEACVSESQFAFVKEVLEISLSYQFCNV